MKTYNLDTIQKVPLREVWPHEAHDFTKWLAEEQNLATLGMAVGIELELIETESSVGSFNVDIYAQESGTGRKVIIENQLEDTNHDHLGKVITYAAGKGAEVEENKHNALEKYKGQYVLVVDGSIPLKDNGIYCMVAGEPIVDHIRKAAEGAAAIIAIGSCSAWGGVAAAGVNPTGAVSLQEVLPGKTVINIPGCPPNPHNFLATVAHIITYGKPPKLDDKNRPTFAYGRLIHEHCERRPHFDAGRFAKEFGDEGHREGWCLYHLGCKGPETYGNCSTLQFCDVGGVWPVAIGHPCYGCNEEGIGFHKGIHQLANVENQTPRSQKPDVNAKEGGNVSAGAIGLLGGVVGLVAGVSVMAVRELGRQQKKDNADSRGE